MSAAALSTVDALTESLRERILGGQLKPGTPLREEALSREYEVARHSLRSALRTLQGEGIVQIEPNRGARVKSLSPEDVRGLSELRIALEVESARMALERGGGRLPAGVHRALERLVAACRRSKASWGAVAEAHEALHHEIVVAADSPRLAEVHRQAGAELRLFVLQLPTTWTLERIADDHVELVRRLETRGADALRPHIEESTRALLEQA
ncbi:MAG TPA: GntR family transcriptional regulator [Thermoleophilaceae bacterium]